MLEQVESFLLKIAVLTCQLEIILNVRTAPPSS